MLGEKLGIDKKDVRILTLLMKDADISQAELAKDLGISQPSINARIHKLREKGILASQVGIEFNKANMYLARVDFTTKNVDEILNELKECSFFVNGFVMSGTSNGSMFVVGHDLRKVETIINSHLRAKPDISNINMSVCVSAAKPFVIGIDLEQEAHECCQDPESCKHCALKHKK